MTKSQAKIFLRFIWYMAGYVLASGGLMVFVYFSFANNIRTNLLNDQNWRMSELEYLVEEIMTYVRSDIEFLAVRTSALQSFNGYNKSQLDDLLSAYASSKKIFDQVRFIDTNGMEISRVNFIEGVAKIVQPENLQIKDDRYYFKETMLLQSDDIYFSPLDLNIENGQMELPIKPVVRIGKLVYNSRGEKTGVVVVNYLASIILDKIKAIDDKLVYHILFVNSDGYFLKGRSPDDEWGFMFSDKVNRTIMNFFPESGAGILRDSSGSFDADYGLFCYSTIWPSHKNDDKFWKLILYLPKDELNVIIWQDYRKWLYLVLLSVLPVMIIFWLLAKNVELKRSANIKIQLKNQSLLEKNEQIFANMEELKTINSVLDESNTMLNQTNKKLSELNGTKDKFFSIIAHDLKNPFSGILGLVKLLNNDFDKLSYVKIKELLKMLQTSAQNVYDLLENLLTWARSQRGLLQFEPGYFSINETISSAFQMHTEAAQQKGISFETNFESELVVYADLNMVNTIITNLVSNAIKFTPQNGKVKALLIEQQKHVQITIEDSGMGISPNDLLNIFKIDAHTTKLGTNNEKGTGLGLILCKEFVDKNGGEIWVDSEVGKGSRFNFTLPKTA